MSKLQFPDLEEIYVGFGKYPIEWFQKALEQAHTEGMTGYNQTKWEKRVSLLFFKGGELRLNLSLDTDYLRKGKALFLAIAGSYRPKHEHKTAVCALILKNIEVDCGDQVSHF